MHVAYHHSQWDTGLPTGKAGTHTGHQALTPGPHCLPLSQAALGQAAPLAQCPRRVLQPGRHAHAVHGPAQHGQYGQVPNEQTCSVGTVTQGGIHARDPVWLSSLQTIMPMRTLHACCFHSICMPSIYHAQRTCLHKTASSLKCMVRYKLQVHAVPITP